MPGTMIEYLKEYGEYSFAERPMNDVDSLVLSQFAYLKFDGMIPSVHENKKSVTLEELAQHADVNKLFADVRYEEENRALFDGMLHTRRFHNLRMNCFINIIEKEWETQFSAITYILDDGTLYIAFRGTDETIVGWKEDFNMAFLSPVPGQAYSVKYLNMITSKLHKPFYIGGHSKGGNLAVYSAMKCLPKVQERIIKIYNMDGPGFHPKVLADGRYGEIADRVVKILPHSSLVGMLFERDIRYRVVESNGLGLLQHDPYSWLVKDGKFIEVDGIYESRVRKNTVLNEWILSLDEEQIRMFVDTLYQVLSASEADDLISFTSDWRKSVVGIITAMKEIDDQTTQMLKEVVKSLFEITVLHQSKNKEEIKRHLRLRPFWKRQDAQDAIEAPE